MLWFTYGVRISWHLFLCKLIWLFIIVAVKCFFGVSDVAFCHTLILTVYLQYVTLYRAAEVRFCHMLFVNGLPWSSVCRSRDIDRMLFCSLIRFAWKIN